MSEQGMSLKLLGVGIILCGMVLSIRAEKILLIRAQLDHSAARSMEFAWQQSCPFDFNLSASSYHEAIGDKNYQPKQVLDEDLATAWVEGVKGYGIGQTLEFKKIAGESSKFTGGFLLVNGLARDDETWKKNARMKRLACFYNGEHVLSVELRDTDYPQYFSIRDASSMEDISFEAGDLFTFMVRDVYKGDVFEDTCLSMFLPMIR